MGRLVVCSQQTQDLSAYAYSVWRLCSELVRVSLLGVRRLLSFLFTAISFATTTLFSFSSSLLDCPSLDPFCASLPLGRHLER